METIVTGPPREDGRAVTDAEKNRGSVGNAAGQKARSAFSTGGAAVARRVGMAWQDREWGGVEAGRT